VAAATSKCFRGGRTTPGTPRESTTRPPGGGATTSGSIPASHNINVDLCLSFSFLFWKKEEEKMSGFFLLLENVVYSFSNSYFSNFLKEYVFIFVRQ
jgi:hypothetical protein